MSKNISFQNITSVVFTYLVHHTAIHYKHLKASTCRYIHQKNKHRGIAVSQLVVRYLFTNYQWYLNRNRYVKSGLISIGFKIPSPPHYVETVELKMMSAQGFKSKADLLIGLCRHLHKVVLRFTAEYDLCLLAANTSSQNLDQAWRLIQLIPKPYLCIQHLSPLWTQHKLMQCLTLSFKTQMIFEFHIYNKNL